MKFLKRFVTKLQSLAKLDPKLVCHKNFEKSFSKKKNNLEIVKELAASPRKKKQTSEDLATGTLWAAQELML